MLLAAMLIVPIAVMFYKIFVLDYAIAELLPVVSYRVDVNMQVNGHGNDITMSTYLPKTDTRQYILDEVNSSGAFTMALATDADNRLATWSAEKVAGEASVRYSYLARADHVRYVIPPELPLPVNRPRGMDEYLAEEEGIQVNDPLIEEAIDRVLPSRDVPMIEALTRIHRYLQDEFKNKDFSGYTDAITALKLGEASCNGKSRLFAAMARKLNMPARLVGGIIMEQGSKRVSHQWVEIYINGHWVPFDTINDHLAELPSHYLTLYYGDLVLFKYTTNVNFRYFFKMTRRLVPKREAIESLGESMFNILNIYSIFERVGIPQNLLKIILMIPIGAFVTVIFRNVIGLETFGTFLPALIAAAARETGVVWGLAGFIFIIVLSSLVRRVLDWLQLLHSPKMAIMLTFVVMVMLTMTVAGVRLGLFDLAHITLFPIAIMAITAERFAIVEIEQGLGRAARVTLATAVVIVACYMVMSSLFLQTMFLAFPELLLVVIALNMWVGKWVGMRFMEFVRFRRLIFGQGQ